MKQTDNISLNGKPLSSMDLHSTPVACVMYVNNPKILETSSVYDAMKVFHGTDLSYLPIINFRNRVVGIIEKEDIFFEFDGTWDCPFDEEKYSTLKEQRAKSLMNDSFLEVPPSFPVGELLKMLNELSEDFAVICHRHKFVGVVNKAEIETFLNN